MYQMQIEFDDNLSNAIYNSWDKLRESGISSFFFTKVIEERPNIPLLNSKDLDVNIIRSELIRFGSKMPSHVPINLSFVGMGGLECSANYLSLHPIPNAALCDLQRNVCQLVARAGFDMEATTPQCQIAFHLENPQLVPAYRVATSALTSLPLRGYAAELVLVKYGRVAVHDQLGNFGPAITLKRYKLLPVALPPGPPPPKQGMAGSVEKYQIQIEFDDKLSRAIYNSWVKLRDSGISSFFFTKLIKERPNIPLLNSYDIDVNRIRGELIRLALKWPSHVPINFSFVGMGDQDFSGNFLSLHPIPNTALYDLQRDVCQLVAQAGFGMEATIPQCQIACQLENPQLAPAYRVATSALTSLPLSGYAAELVLVKYTSSDAGRVAVDDQLGNIGPAITLKRDKLLYVALPAPPKRGG